MAKDSDDGHKPDEHPDPEVRRAWREGQSGMVNGQTYNPMTGKYEPKK